MHRTRTSHIPDIGRNMSVPSYPLTEVNCTYKNRMLLIQLGTYGSSILGSWSGLEVSRFLGTVYEAVGDRMISCVHCAASMKLH